MNELIHYFSGKLSTTQCHQMKVLQQLYQKWILDSADLSHQSAVEASESFFLNNAEPIVYKETLKKRIEAFSEKPHFKTAPLSNFCYDISNWIQTYLQAQKVTFFKKTDLIAIYFLIEIEQVFLRSLSEINISSHSVSLIKNRIDYFERVLFRQLFVTDKHLGEHSMVYLLWKITENLKTKVLPQLLKQLNDSATVNAFDRLIHLGRDQLRLGIEYLYYIFRNYPTHQKRFSLSNTKDLKLTRSGNYLNQLLQSALFKMVLFQEQKETADFQKLKFVLKGRYQSEIVKCYLFSNESKSKKPVGICPEFYGYGDPFIRLHLLLGEEAKMLLLLKRARGLAEEGGKILIYGLVHKKILKLMTVYQKLHLEIEKHYQDLDGIASKHYGKMLEIVQFEKARESYYFNAQKISKTLRQKLAQSDRIIDEVISYSRKTLCEKSMHHLKNQMDNFVLETDNFVEKLEQLLDQPSSLASTKAGVKPPLKLLDQRVRKKRHPARGQADLLKKIISHSQCVDSNKKNHPRRSDANNRHQTLS